MTRGEKKFLLILFIVLALWRIFELPGVATAFWDFCTAGQIPGSNRVLAPETMIRVWIAVLMLVLGVIFRKELIASLPRRIIVEENGRMIQKKSKAKKSPVVIVLPLKKVKTRRAYIRPFAVRLMRRMGGVIRTAARGIFAAVVAMWQYTVQFAKAVAKTLIRFWRWLEPHIRTFDNWINVMMHRNKKIATALEAAEEVRKGLAPVYQTARTKITSAHKRPQP